MRAPLAISLLLLLVSPALAGCIVPENMEVLREELGYASVELPDVIVKARADTMKPRVHQPVQLTAEVEGVASTATELVWDLGDGARLTGTAVDHAWTEPGTYRVRLSAVPLEGQGSGPAEDSFDITVRENAPPVPRLTVENGDDLVEGEPVVLSAEATSDPDGDALTYAWEIDGDVLDETGPRIEQALDAGVHRVRLTVDDGLDPVVVFEQVPVGLAIDHTGEVSLTGPSATSATFTVLKGASELVVTLTHDTRVGLDDVDLVLKDRDGTVVATSANEPALAASTAEESLRVSGDRLGPGTYTLEGQLVRGLGATATIEAVLKYSPLSAAP